MGYFVAGKGFYKAYRVFLILLMLGFWLPGMAADVNMPTPSEEELPSLPDFLKLDPAPASTAIPAASASMAILNLEGVSSYSHYIQTLHTELRKHWKPRELQGRSGGRTVVAFEVNHDGVLGDVKVTEASGNPQVDEAAMVAIQKASPFPPFPADLAMEKMVVQYIFDFYKPF